MADAWPIPASIELIESERGLCLRGDARSVAEFCNKNLRQLAQMQPGAVISVGDWYLAVEDHVPHQRPHHRVVMPAHAWNIAASVLRDVAWGDYHSPFFFRDVGYLAPAADPDIGVEIVGPTLVE